MFSTFWLLNLKVTSHSRLQVSRGSSWARSITEMQRKALNTAIQGFLTSNAYLCKSSCKSLGAAQDILLDARHLWFSLCREHPSNFSQQLLIALQQTPHICQCLQWCKEPAAYISTILLKHEEQGVLILPQQIEWKKGKPATCL